MEIRHKQLSNAQTFCVKGYFIRDTEHVSKVEQT